MEELMTKSNVVNLFDFVNDDQCLLLVYDDGEIIPGLGGEKLIDQCIRGNEELYTKFKWGRN